ncbi:hypothetical protein G647_03847 [Cladophialophora carrionii CBS 160.54]|uniref:Uncharacterized protein n=1 Tax=Cladophialophora carrionii CBS 160.54 TaxID=1279043 RepID=V9DDT4_9EURO|nr:uncharacterized protein G647_03847 [Cladophialophora carrionii CBS 160.54]ETI24478.1 hypothetical protein G647_03847 [Cladophialophora carrionii CBS 160.54]
MDQALKARKMGSASARRRKMQERQQQQALDRERHVEHKRRILMYDHRADRQSAYMDDLEYDVADECDGSAGRSDRESSVETQSERSASTPDDMLQNKTTFGGQPSTTSHTLTALKIQIPDEDEVLHRMELDENRIIIPPSPKPLLQASLATLSDFRYDRYSTILDSPLSETLSPDLDTDETFSPIETATPISYQQPKSRPSLISIVSVSDRSKRRTASLQSPLSQMVQQTVERPTKRQSTSSIRAAFPAAEATLFEVPNLPDNAFELIASASQESLPLSGKEVPRSKAERKPSMPRLSTALSHARMSSIKSLIKTPTTATPSATRRTSISRPSSHISRPSTASVPASEVASIMRNPAALSSSSDLNSMTRPPTSHSSSISMAGAGNTMTALPSLPTPPADDGVSDPLAAKPAMQRKKSFSALRRRSESIGQAIKGLSKLTPKHDVPLPTTPSIMTPKRLQEFDLSKFPTPPLPSPRTGQSSASSFTSSRARSSGGFVGLGLRSVEGLSQR